eukprot:CAMPEP_0205799928 /NCGR_PEP_ID=MMETSP0205-20121125/1415_1 /ASSEMBLY_ACC=CAM_ASM_000278 /TAXON_ID=36767 /ORGANISM="Euplotes focardii, Strain TN1" /LENGTH=218 /DNA_ID=CAMNT_0053062163 /DNA_START=117 /DNA_END=773 /DNA_ORIENTATION=+
MSQSYYENILEPMLEFNCIDYEMFKTDSETFIHKFFSNFKLNDNVFTEFVVIGGDGIFGQVINSMMGHEDNEKLIQMPIGIMPGGSTNSLCCDLGGKNPFIAAMNIIKGSVINSDIFKVDIPNNEKPLYSTALTYGMPVDLVRQSENLRGLFGRYRYIAVAAKKFITPGEFPRFESEVYYKLDKEDASKLDLSNSNTISPSKSHINIPKSKVIKTKSS